MEVEIRTMTKEDWPDVSRIYQQGIDTNRATLQPECPSFEEWDGSHLPACRLVALADGRVAGWAALTPVSGRCVYSGVAEVSIYIAENWREKGVGCRLLAATISDSEKSGFWTLQSGILEENAASLRLHEKCGFRIVGRREKMGRDRFGRWRNTVLVEKRSALPQYA